MQIRRHHTGDDHRRSSGDRARHRRRLGISTPDDTVMTGRELAGCPTTQLASRIAHTRVYARVDPAQKIRIVTALQAAASSSR